MRLLIRCISTVILVLPLLNGCVSSERSKPIPNIVLIIIDTLRPDTLGVYNPPLDSSPELDKVFNQGARFNLALAQSSWARASTASLFTSQFPRSIKVEYALGDILKPEVKTLAEALQQKGFRTIGVMANPYLNSEFGFSQGFGEYLDRDSIDGIPAPQCVAKTLRGNPTADCIYQLALEKLRKPQPGNPKNKQPFFLAVNLMEVHDREGINSQSKDLDVKDSKSGVAKIQARSTDLYLESVRSVSVASERFFNEVKQLPADDGTLFIILSDHGEGLFDHACVADSVSHGRVLYRSNIHVPLGIIHTKDELFFNKVIDTPVQLIDVAPTIMEYIGAERSMQGEGRSLLPLLRGDNDVRKEFLSRPIFAETHYDDANKVAVYLNDRLAILNSDQLSNSEREILPFWGPQTGCLPSQAVRLREDQLAGHYLKLIDDWESTYPRVESREESSVAARDK